MLGFFDESGDPGLKVGGGSSRFFVVAWVTFAEEEEALRCDRRIDGLRGELQLPATYEFHFAKNPWKIREAFLRAAQVFDFQYHLFILDKAAVIREGRPLRSPEALYQETAGLLFEQARPYLNNAVIVMDKRGDRQFREGLSRHLRGSIRQFRGDRVIGKVRQKESHRNNLLQLVDYAASIEHQASNGKRAAVELQERYLRRKESTRGRWTELKADS